MKRIIIFIGLKTAEISALGLFVFGLAYIGHFGWLDFGSGRWRLDTWMGFWQAFAEGLLWLIIFTGSIGVFALLVLVFKANWKWSKKLTKKGE